MVASARHRPTRPRHLGAARRRHRLHHRHRRPRDRHLHPHRARAGPHGPVGPVPRRRHERRARDPPGSGARRRPGAVGAHRGHRGAAGRLDSAGRPLRGSGGGGRGDRALPIRPDDGCRPLAPPAPPRAADDRSRGDQARRHPHRPQRHRPGLVGLPRRRRGRGQPGLGRDPQRVHQLPRAVAVDGVGTDDRPGQPRRRGHDRHRMVRRRASREMGVTPGRPGRGGVRRHAAPRPVPRPGRAP